MSSIPSWISAKAETCTTLEFVGEGEGILNHYFNAILVFFSFCSQTKLGDPTMYWDQAWETTSKNPTLSIQRGLYLKGSGPNSSSLSNNREIGWWSDVSFSNILVETRDFPSIRELLTRNRSSLADIFVALALWLDQVNRPDFGLRSFKSQFIIISSTKLSMKSMPCCPPFFP